MAIAYTWSFPQLEVAPSEGGLNDVIKTIHWRYDAQDGEFSAGAYGTVSLAEPDPEAFVPFDGLTEAKVIEWVSESVDVPALEASLAAEIDAKKHPKTYTVTPNFNAA
jgi:hypothetical protein